MYDNLKRLRTNKKVTLLQMSKLLGYNSPNAYSRKEKGERKFTLDEAKKISTFFNLPIEEIFFNPKVPNKGNKNEIYFNQKQVV
ncbi:helix-turn-helix transcriptional regulator [Clostridium sp. Mt-5]|uniref:Helix-turn-helix transcriptional regulator n=1 Tax=Clostridium moutaii TaxID=3240932 RepID=A0ABV4BIN8_9CLOT